MTQASVGYHCPECLSSHGQQTYRPADLRTAPLATKWLIGINVAIYAGLVLAGGGTNLMSLPDSELARQLWLVGGGWQWGPGVGVAEGEWWRLVSSGFMHANLIHLGMNMLVLWILGSMLEPAIGRPRFLALYAASLLAGSMGVMLIEPTAATVGASGAIFGLMGASVALQRARGINPWQSGLGGLILINLLITFGVPGISVGGHLGGLIGGLICGGAVFAVQRRTDSPWASVGVCAALSVVFVAVALWASTQWRDPVLGVLSF
jgi:membrane associated rhomboid family serine protease